MSPSLYELRRKMERKKLLDKVLEDLTQQQKELEKQLVTLRAACRREDEDVLRLEGHSFASLFYAVIGQKTEKLEKERAEAYAAMAKYETAAAQLEALKEEIRRKKAESRDARRAETQYRYVLEEKAEALRHSETEAGARFQELEKRLAASEAYLQEMEEAVVAGIEARSCADEVLRHLEEAKMLGEIDMFTGSTVLHLTKHGELDSAQRRIENLQNALRRLKAELADVRISADAAVTVNATLRFSDWFFDGFLVDWAVLDHIEQSRGRIREVRGKISDLTDQLRQKRDAAQSECASLRSERNACIWDAEP